MKRKGKSRIWFKDNGWWLAVVEFQPSDWGKGTYLNVAATWLWHANEYLSFDEYERADSFAELTDPATFALTVNDYASLAATKVVSLCNQFATLSSVARHLRTKVGGNPWQHYHAMMASLANGELEFARVQLNELLQFEDNVPWCLDLKAKAAKTMDEASDGCVARALVENEIATARKFLKLPLVENSSIWLVD